MSTIVQSICPHCQKTLRVPAVWAHRTVRCKFCSTHIENALFPTQANGDGGSLVQVAQRRSAGPKMSPRTFYALLGGGVLGLLLLAGALAAAVSFFRSPGDPQTAQSGGKGKRGPGDDKAKTKLPVMKGGNSAFPRRALLIGVNNYLFYNTLLYGKPSLKGQVPEFSTGELIGTLPRLLHFPATQVLELSDGSLNAQPTQKAVLQMTIDDFLVSSRPQDRILLWFSGHACVLKGEGYLIPIEGRTDNPETLIPLRWLFDQLARCKARQKVLVIDAFRYNPARGFELPGTGEGERGEMPEEFEKLLETPPGGVQVLASCSKGQAGLELEHGGAFTQAFREALNRGAKMTGIATPADALPMESLVANINVRLKEILKGEKAVQTARLTGAAPSDGAAPNPEEAPATIVSVHPAPEPPGGSAGNAMVDRILDEIRLLPPVRATRAGDANLLRAANLPPFSAKALDEFKADYDSITALRERGKTDKNFAAKFPLRAAVFEALKVLDQTNAKIEIMETLPGPIDPKRKTEFLNKQRDPGMAIYELEEALDMLKEAAGKRDEEASKRWQANFDYTMARLESRIVYLFEYSFILGQVRGETLPPLEDGQSGWRVGARKKVQVGEPKVKTMVKDITRLWKRIEEQYPDTPWSLLAKRESLIALGLEWRGKSD